MDITSPDDTDRRLDELAAWYRHETPRPGAIERLLAVIAAPGAPLHDTDLDRVAAAGTPGLLPPEDPQDGVQ